MSHPQDLGLGAQAEAIRRGELDAGELLEATLARIAARDGALNSTPVVFGEESRAMLKSAPEGPLYGVPVTVKDMYALPWRGARNATALELIPAGASGAYRRLRDAGAVVVGVANQDELGMGTTGVASVYGSIRNPWDLERCAGGSSGGSAAAVAAHLVGASLGSDTGGSTRLPAAYCGVLGLKVTYGALPYDGYFGAATTFSAPGALARDSADVRLFAEALLARPLEVGDGVHLRVGIVRDPFVDDADPEVAAAFEATLALCGWRLGEVRVEHLEIAGAVALARLSAEVGSPPDALVATLSDFTRALVLASSLSPARFVPRADRVRAALRRSLHEAFGDYDLLAWPTTPAPVPTRAHPWVQLRSGCVLADQANLRQAVLANLCGVPAISVPMGLDANGAPMGLQLFAPWGEEARLLDAATHVERVSERAYVDLVAPIARA